MKNKISIPKMIDMAKDGKKPSSTPKYLRNMFVPKIVSIKGDK